MIQKESVNKEAAAIVPEQIEQLRGLFPQAFTEGKIDFDKLKESLGEEIDSRKTISSLIIMRVHVHRPKLSWS